MRSVLEFAFVSLCAVVIVTVAFLWGALREVFRLAVALIVILAWAVVSLASAQVFGPPPMAVPPSAHRVALTTALYQAGGPVTVTAPVGSSFTCTVTAAGAVCVFAPAPVVPTAGIPTVGTLVTGPDGIAHCRTHGTGYAPSFTGALPQGATGAVMLPNELSANCVLP